MPRIARFPDSFPALARPGRAAAAAMAVALLATMPGAAAAADNRDYPSRPIRLIVPFSPGGTSDTLARILGQKITDAWKQQVVVDSRPGASGIIGTEIAARAPADGYTLMHGNLSQFAINPHLFRKLPYETLRDFAPLSLVGSAPQLVVVHPGVAARTVQEFVQLARTRPGTLNFGSGGAGTLAFIGGEMLRATAGTDIVHVAYKGTVLALNDLLAGQVHVMFSDMPIALPHARSGKLRALAVTGAKRTPLVPDMPSMAEAGVTGYALDNWWGILAPAGIPRDLAARLNAVIVQAQGLPDLRERYAALGVEAVSGTSAQFTEYIRTESAKFGRIIRDSGARVE